MTFTIEVEAILYIKDICLWIVDNRREKNVFENAQARNKIIYNCQQTWLLYAVHYGVLISLIVYQCITKLLRVLLAK